MEQGRWFFAVWVITYVLTRYVFLGLKKKNIIEAKRIVFFKTRIVIRIQEESQKLI